jgi:hypothetical protein
MLTWEDAKAILSAGVRVRRAVWPSDRYVFLSVRVTGPSSYWMRRLDSTVPYEANAADCAAGDWEVADGF